MIVCDECRDVNARAFDCCIILEKTEDAVSKRESSEGKPRRIRNREVVRVPLALCEKCITQVCKSIGHMKASGTLGKRGREPKEDAQ